MYVGTVVGESLQNEKILKDFKVISKSITSGGWHLFQVESELKQIKNLSHLLKKEKWYSHFWEGDNVIAVFPGKTFMFKYSDKSTWKQAIKYGKSIGIPQEQLDFVIH